MSELFFLNRPLVADSLDRIAGTLGTIGTSLASGDFHRKDPISAEPGPVTSGPVPVYNQPPAFAKVSPVNRAAHLLSCFYVSRAIEICKEEGITDDQIQRALYVHAMRREVRAELREWYGSPEFGSWPAQAGDDRRNELRKRGLSEEEIAG
jgi:hypothetical protein